MTRTITKTPSELRETIDGLLASLNEALLEDSHSAITETLDKLDEAISDYNMAARLAKMAEWRKSEVPMESAIRELYYTALSLKDTPDSDGITTYRVEPRQKPIDLLDFQKFCGHNIGHELDWNFRVEKFGFMMAIRVAKEIGADASEVEKRYKIDPKALGINIDENCSNTKLLKTLQSVVDSIIYAEETTVANGKVQNAYKVTSHDVAWFILTLTKASNKGTHTLSYANIKTIRQLLSRVINRIVTGSAYDMEFKRKKDNDPDNGVPTTKKDGAGKKSKSKKDEMVVEKETIA